MDPEPCQPDDELLRELAAVLSTVPTSGPGPTVQDVVDAGRASFAWWAVLAELEVLLPGAAGAGPEPAVGRLRSRPP